MEFKVLINGIEKVHEFQNIIAGFDGDFDLISGNIHVDARSFLGIMTLNLSQPITLRTNSTSDRVREDLAEFIVG